MYWRSKLVEVHHSNFAERDIMQLTSPKNDKVQIYEQININLNGKRVLIRDVCSNCGTENLEQIEYEQNKYKLWNNKSNCFHQCGKD